MKAENAKSQKEMILDALAAGEKVTPLDALQRFGCMRLGARIWDLKREGHPIGSEAVRTAGGSTVARYYLKRERRSQEN